MAADDFIRTSTDPRHQPGVNRLWQACEVAGDLYRDSYQGLYCVGCEQFYDPKELDDGRCPEHATVPERIAEENLVLPPLALPGPAGGTDRKRAAAHRA